MAIRYYLAIDLGAESGRGVLGEFNSELVSLREIGRFPTSRGDQDMCADGVQRWDIERIYREIDNLVSQASIETNGKLEGVAVDSWGVDVGFFDKDGNLLAPPVQYRDRSHAAAREKALQIVPEGEIWDATGIQGMPFNTLYQLLAIKEREPELLDKAHRMLNIPDVLHNLLTEGRHGSAEMTMGSTTQLMTPGAKAWNTDLLKRFGLPAHFLSPIIQPGTKIGVTAHGVPVYAPASHDTASAVAATPADRSSKWAFISSGTWSLFGAELPSPILSREAMSLGFSNEGGVAGTTRFLKNIMGLWLVQQSRRCIKATTGIEYSYPDLVTLATEAACTSLIDAVHNRFLNPHDMVEEIQAACRESNQYVPITPGEIVRCCFESLALAYRSALNGLRTMLNQEFDTLHIIGGGSQNELLNQWTADACGVTVYAGPSEATALGNILGQLVGSGEVKDWNEAREISRRSFAPKVYTPNKEAREKWESRGLA